MAKNGTAHWAQPGLQGLRALLTLFGSLGNHPGLHGTVAAARRDCSTPRARWEGAPSPSSLP